MFSSRSIHLLIRRVGNPPCKNQLSTLSVVGQPSTQTFKQPSFRSFPTASYTKHFTNPINHSAFNVRYYSNGKTATSFNVQNEDDFKARVLESKTPTVVWFHAEWCGPCKLLGPRLTKEVDSQGGKVMLAMVDIDDFGDLAMEYEIMAVPTVLLFKSGKNIDRFQGNIGDDALQSFVKDAVQS